MNSPVSDRSYWWAGDFLRAVGTPGEGPSRGAVAIRPGVAEVGVEGRGFRRFAATIRASVLAEAQWEEFFRLVGERALLPAALLAGYLPRDGRQMLASRGIRLIPPGRSLTTEPEDGDVAAIAHRAVAHAFAEDPFRLLHFRGCPPDRVLRRIEAAWASDVPASRSMSLGELETVLAEAPDGGGLLPAVQQADAFRETRVARVGLARLFGKVSERVAAMNRPPAG